MSIAAKYRPYYTYEDYCQWEGRWELIEGMPYAMSPLPGPVHQRVCVLLGVQFLKVFKKIKNWTVYPSIDWKITEDTVIHPDLIICNNIPIDKKFLDFLPPLVVEILSPSTAAKDRGEKMELYQSKKVKYYLIVDPQFKKVDIYEYLYTQYELISISPKNYVFNLNSGCIAKVNFSDIWE